MIKDKYKNINYELKKDGSYYCIYEYTPILKKRKDIFFGASIKNTYDIDYIKNIIDKAIKAQ